MLYFVGNNTTLTADTALAEPGSFVLDDPFLVLHKPPLELLVLPLNEPSIADVAPLTNESVPVSASASQVSPHSPKAHPPTGSGTKRKVSTQDIQKMQVEVLNLEKEKISLEIENMKLIQKKLKLEIQQLELEH